MDLTSNFFVLCTNVKVYIIIPNKWSLACILMKERANEPVYLCNFGSHLTNIKSLL